MMVTDLPDGFKHARLFITKLPGKEQKPKKKKKDKNKKAPNVGFMD